MSAPTDTKETDYRIKGTGGWSNAWLYAAIVGGIGLVLSAYGAFTDPARFAFSWLFGFMAVLTVAMGALFFVLIQFLTVASWSVTVRRLAEFFVAGIPVLAVLFVPVFLLRGHLYSEWLDHGHGAEETHAAADDGGVSPTDLLGSTAKAQDHQPAEHGQEPAHGAGDAHGGEHGEDAAHGDEHGGHHAPHHVLHSKILTHKSAFLSGPFWTARAVFYFLVWIVLGLYYFRASTRQDKSRDLQETVRMQRWAPLGLIFYGWTLSFAAFDWMMSLQPGWYSTIFGVCVFAGALVAIHALLCVMSLSLRRAGILGDAVNTEHLHDLGKLTFGFMVFWAYVSFSQMMLIWYAGIPEEAVYYHLRWGDHGWTSVSIFLLVGHFVLPFFFLMSRNVKRRLALLGIGTAWMLLMHVVDIYWYVLPHFGNNAIVADFAQSMEQGLQVRFEPSLMDVAALMAVAGVYLSVVFSIMKKYPVIPVGDPRLSRSLHFHNA